MMLTHSLCGLRPGQRLFMINGIPVAGTNTEDATDAIKKSGNALKLLVWPIPRD